MTRSLPGVATLVALCIVIAPSAALPEGMTAPPAATPPQAMAREYRGDEVKRVRISGLDSSLADALRAGLELSGERTLLGSERARFYPPTLRRDLERARLFLAREGYPRASIHASVVPVEGSEEVEVRLDIDPGAPVRIARVDRHGFPRQLRKDILESISLRRGERFRDADLERSVAIARGELQNAGYARASVREEVLPVDSSRVAVVITADPGPLCTFREVRVSGTQEDLVRLVRRTAGLRRGEVYSARRIERVRDQLRLLGLFRQVRLEIEDAPGFDREAERGEVDLLIQLLDRPPRSLETGVGFWTEDLLRVQGRWQHRNLFRAGRGFDVGGLFSQPRREIESSVWWPALFRSDLRGQLSGRVAWEYEDAYRARRRGGDLSFVYRPSFRSTVRAGLELERVTIEGRGEVTRAEQTSLRETQVRIAGRWSFDNTDDRLDPGSGQLAVLEARTVIPTGLAKNRFTVYEAGLSQYFRLLSRTVLALRANVGWARASEGELPAIYRFFAGGATSMRGYRRNRLGPLDATGTPIGGEAKLELGAEIRYPLWKSFRGTLFFDAAEVWLDRRSLNLAGLETAAGAGIVFTSPIGPVRLDVGVPLEPLPEGTDDPEYVIHALVGHPF